MTAAISTTTVSNTRRIKSRGPVPVPCTLFGVFGIAPVNNCSSFSFKALWWTVSSVPWILFSCYKISFKNLISFKTSEYADHGNVGGKEKDNKRLSLVFFSPIIEYFFLHTFKWYFHSLFLTSAPFGTFITSLSMYNDSIPVLESIKLIGGKLMEQAGMIKNNYLCIMAFDKLAIWGALT